MAGMSRMAVIGQELDIGPELDYCNVLIYLCIRASRDGITLLTTVYQSKKLNLPLPSSEQVTTFMLTKHPAS